MIQVRDARPDDLDGIQIVSTSAIAMLRKLYRPKPETIAQRSNLGGALRRLVATSAHEVVGTTQYYFDQDALCIIGLMVRPDLQRQGIARALIAHVTLIAEREHTPWMVARTIKETGNVPIFEKLGFTVAQERLDTLFISDIHASLTEVEMLKRVGLKQAGQEAGTHESP